MKFSNHKKQSELLRLAFSGWGLSFNGVINNQQGEWWLVGQLTLIFAHLLTPWPLLRGSSFVWPKIFFITGLCLLFIGIILTIRAFFSLGPSLSPLPDPKPGAALITDGPYKQCRHPIYQGLLISSCGVTTSLGSALHLILFLSLCILLKGKAQREENRLKSLHADYKSYMAKTPAIIQYFPLLDWRV